MGVSSMPIHRGKLGVSFATIFAFEGPVKKYKFHHIQVRFPTVEEWREKKDRWRKLVSTNLSPVCVRMWLSRWHCSKNLASQIMHSKFLTRLSSWTVTCRSNRFFSANCLPHTGHFNPASGSSSEVEHLGFNLGITHKNKISARTETTRFAVISSCSSCPSREQTSPREVPESAKNPISTRGTISQDQIKQWTIHIQLRQHWTIKPC